MTDKVRVWSPDGKMEEHTSANARDLVTHAKWTRHPPIPAEPAPAPAPAPAAPAAEAKVDAPTPTPAPAAPVDLTAMTREGLVRFAKENFDMEFDANVPNQAIIDAILAEQG